MPQWHIKLDKMRESHVCTAIWRRIPTSYFLLIRSLAVLEGIATASDPSFRVIERVYPWISKRLLSDPDPGIRQTLADLLYENGEFQYSRLEKLLVQASFDQMAEPSTGDERSAMSREDRINTIRSGLMFFLCEEMSFVRDAILDELSKAMDAGSRALLEQLVKSVFRQGASCTVTALCIVLKEELVTIERKERRGSGRDGHLDTRGG